MVRSDGSGDITRSPGYVIEPLNYGHKLVHKETEPFTDFDFFVTRQNDCERFVSENSQYHPDCGEDILQFVNNESLIDEDIVVWHRISFHHVPRNEDRHQMHSHWDGFLMQASNISSLTPGHSGLVENRPPEVVTPKDLQHSISDTVEIEIVTTDPDGDELTYETRGLPGGIKISESGVLSGEIDEAGDFRITILVSDSVHTTSVSFNWQVNRVVIGVFDLFMWIALLIVLVLRRKTA